MNDNRVAFDTQVKFTERIKKMKQEEMLEMVNIVKANCKNAIVELDTKRIQVKLDMIDKKTFDIILK